MLIRWYFDIQGVRKVFGTAKKIHVPAVQTILFRDEHHGNFALNSITFVIVNLVSRNSVKLADLGVLCLVVRW